MYLSYEKDFSIQQCRNWVPYDTFDPENSLVALWALWTCTGATQKTGKFNDMRAPLFWAFALQGRFWGPLESNLHGAQPPDKSFWMWMHDNVSTQCPALVVP